MSGIPHDLIEHTLKIGINCFTVQREVPADRVKAFRRLQKTMIPKIIHFSLFLKPKMIVGKSFTEITFANPEYMKCYHEFNP